ncbi:hypothetical protein P4O66_018710, partial [Electrophorus voltai]
MHKDIVRYVASCSNCAHNKIPRTPPAGKLLPLPTPIRPWSHLAIDFITDFPVSESNTVILVIVDRFSKMVRFLPLKGLPTAWETADQLFRHVFRQFGLPEDIVSDRRPQFTSRVWKELLGKMNIPVSLTSGYHPQANRQGSSPRYIYGIPPHLTSQLWSRSEQVWEEVHQKLRRATTDYKWKAETSREPGIWGFPCIDPEAGCGGRSSMSWTGKGMDLRSAAEYRPAKCRTLTSLPPFIGNILRSLPLGGRVGRAPEGWQDLRH